MGHAAIGCTGRAVFRGAAARSNCAKDHSLVFGRSLVTPHDYDFLRKCLKDRSGLVLSADKQYLVESRLLPVARKAGLTTLGELVGMIRDAHDPALMTTVVEAMTTNESFFF